MGLLSNGHTSWEHSILRNALGILCGSSSIDYAFQRWLKRKWNRERKGGFAGIVTQLGLTSGEHLLEKATEWFRQHKDTLTKDTDFSDKDIYVRPMKGATGSGVSEPIDL